MRATEIFEGLPLLDPESLRQWRDWHTDHGETSGPVWVVTRPRGSGVRFREAIEHACCFGWVDSLAKKTEPQSCRLRFARRRPDSTWGPGNRRRAEQMIAAGLMPETGHRAIRTARDNGRWPEVQGIEGDAEGS